MAETVAAAVLLLWQKVPLCWLLQKEVMAEALPAWPIMVALVEVAALAVEAAVRVMKVLRVVTAVQMARAEPLVTAEALVELALV